jgi:hypothetical protein
MENMPMTSSANAALTCRLAIMTLVALGPGVGASRAAAEIGRAPAATHLAQNSGAGRMCAQVISCGTKNGKRKQYPTPCAAQDDGATNIAPMTGSSCD